MQHKKQIFNLFESMHKNKRGFESEITEGDIHNTYLKLDTILSNGISPEKLTDMFQAYHDMDCMKRKVDIESIFKKAY